MRRFLTLGFLVLVLAGLCWWALQAAGGGVQGAVPFGETSPAPGVGPSTVVERGAVPDDGVAAEVAGSARVAVPSTGAAAAAIDRAIVGRVIDQDGEPVGGAEVTATPTWSFEDMTWNMLDWSDPTAMRERFDRMRAARTGGLTADDGTFCVAIPEDAQALEVTTRRRGFVTVTKPQVRVPSVGDVDVGTQELDRAAIVSGLVVDRAGRPIADAMITSVEPANADGMLAGFAEFVEQSELFGALELSRSADDGSFELPGAAAGSLVLIVHHRDHPTWRSDVMEVARGGSVDGVRVVLADGAAISGRVVGLPADVGALRVRASLLPTDAERRSAERPGAEFLDSAMSDPFGRGQRSVEVGDDGRFVLPGLLPRRGYRVWATTRPGAVPIPRVCSTTVEALAGASDLELHHDPGVVVRLRTVDARRDGPIERLVVRHWFDDGVTGGFDYFDWFSRQNVRPQDFPGGEVSIGGLRPPEGATFHLTIDAVGYRQFERAGVTLPLSGTIDLGTVRLEPAQVLRVDVTDAEAGTPVVGATIRLRGEDQAESNMYMMFDGAGKPTEIGVTDADGHGEVNVEPGATLVVEVRDRDHAPYLSETLTVPTSGDLEHRVALLRGGSVEVLAVEDDGETPAAGVQVDWRAPGGPRAGRPTDARGRTLFEHLAPGSHAFRLGSTSEDGTFAMQYGFAMSADDPLGEGWESAEVVDGVTTTLRLQKAPSARVAGSVRENGLALAGAQVMFLPRSKGDSEEEPEPWFNSMRGDWSTETDADGRYEIADLPAGDYVAHIEHESRQMVSEVQARLALGENALDIDLDCAVVHGVVRDPDGAPLAGAAIAVGPEQGAGPAEIAWSGSLMMDSGLVTTDASGRFELRGVRSGAPLVVTAEHHTHAPGQSAAFTVMPGGSLTGVEVRLVLGGSIRVRVTGSARPEMVFATLDGGSGGMKSAEPGADGAALLQGLRPGKWSVQIWHEGGSPDPRTVEVVAGETAEVVF